MGSQAPDQLACRPGGPPGGKDVIHHQHPVSWPKRVPMRFEGIAAVLQVISLGGALPGQLSRFPGRRESGAQRGCQSSSQDEPSRLDAEDMSNACVAEGTPHLLHHRTQQRTLPQDWSDVLKEDARLGIVGNDPQ